MKRRRIIPVIKPTCLTRLSIMFLNLLWYLLIRQMTSENGHRECQTRYLYISISYNIQYFWLYIPHKTDFASFFILLLSKNINSISYVNFFLCNRQIKFYIYVIHIKIKRCIEYSLICRISCS